MTRRSSLGLTAWAILVAGGCGGGGGDGGEAAQGDPARGGTIFEEQGCGNCHTFAAANADGLVGPSLDEVVQRYDRTFVRESLVDPGAFVEKGTGGSIGGDEEYGNIMPSYGPESEIDTNQLSEKQLADLIAYLFAGKA